MSYQRENVMQQKQSPATSVSTVSSNHYISLYIYSQTNNKNECWLVIDFGKVRIEIEANLARVGVGKRSAPTTITKWLFCYRVSK